MTVLPSTYPHLHALLGDALFDVSEPLAQKMEEGLCHAAESVPQPAFFSFLDERGQGRCADGGPWSELKLTPARALDLARATRNLAGASAVAAVLHAAHVAREDEGPGSCLRADLVDGLFRAWVELSETAERSLR